MSRQLLAIYGTEFEDLDEEQAKLGPQKKPTAIQDQIATDEFGKRRFHGAFTGGFSAGYWNTVGSKEGWKPSEFRSSKDQRTNLSQMKPEDIMDAEDLGEFGIGARKIRQTDTFSREVNVGKRRMAWEHDSTSSSMLAESLAGVVKPTKNSIGSIMLHKMGWREGRGVGLATIKQKQSRGGETSEADFDRKQASKVAPGYDLSLEDELVIQLVPCTGSHGLGYTGLKQTNVLDEKWGLLEASLKADNLKKKSRGIRGQAFGVGAFEEEDESVYTQFDMSQYDFALDGPGGKNEPKAQLVDFTFEEMPKKQNSRKFYNSPRLPEGWKPNHKSIPIDVSKLPESLRNAMTNLTVEQRASLLGEDRIKKASEGKKTDEKREGPRRSRWDVRTEQVAQERQGDINRIEFPNEPMKQRRFKEFLTYIKRGLPWPKPTDLSVWEWESEKKDFESKLTPHERALLPEVKSRLEPLAKSNLSLPIKEIMANKFTAETGSSGHVAQKDEDKMAAVKMNMFGDRTRSTFDWYPDNLIARRFNVPNPYPGATFSGCPHLQKTHKQATLADLGLPNTTGELVMRKHEAEKIEPEEIVEELKEPEEQTPKIQQPTSIFDAIFGASDNEESSSSEDEKTNKAEILTAEQNKKSEQIPQDVQSETQQKFISVMDLYNDEEYGPAAPPGHTEQTEGLTAFSVLRYLKDELKERKQRKHSKDRDRKKKNKDKKHSKKSKKERKSKKSKKKGKKHHHKDSTPEDSSDDSDSDSSVLSASPSPKIITLE